MVAIVLSLAILFAVIIYSKQITDYFINVFRKNAMKKAGLGKVRFA